MNVASGNSIPVAVGGPLTAAASLVVDHGSRGQAQQLWGSSLAAPWLVGFIFPDQGLNPCLLHWEGDSLPLSHQGSPGIFV